jgi:mRNA-degrading endonuclease RelE of RelBE toxin-antitoxin system
MVIVETPIFTRQVLATLTTEEYRQLQLTLVEHPAGGRVIPGSGGLRKMRWTVAGRGKRGGTRVIYYWFQTRAIILLLFIYPKNVQDDLTSEQLRQIREIVESEYHGR